jgi:Xaa-Pro aminopeptidase
MEFPLAEYETRLAAVHAHMERREIDALVLTNEKNIRYLSGYHNQGWVSPTRARYLVVRRGEHPVAVIPSTNVAGFREMSWVSDVRHWSNPAGAEGVSILAEAIGGGRRTRLGIESGPESRWQSTLDDLWDLQRKLPAAELVDAHEIMIGARRIKSAGEIAIMRSLAGEVSEVLDEIEPLRKAEGEEDIYFSLLQRLIHRRIARTPYLVVVAGSHGYEQINSGPLGRGIGPGSVICVDTGCSKEGYFCDFTRNYSVGDPDEEIASVYSRLYQATQAALEGVRPGRRCCDVWKDMASVLGVAGDASPVGRMGHGIGLDLTEPPSISAGDETVLEAGMTITIEPSLVFEAQGRRKIMVHEENLAVTETGYELLTMRAPRAIHVLRR